MNRFNSLKHEQHSDVLSFNQKKEKEKNKKYPESHFLEHVQH